MSDDNSLEDPEDPVLPRSRISKKRKRISSVKDSSGESSDDSSSEGERENSSNSDKESPV